MLVINKQGPNTIWVPKKIIFLADLFDNKKETLFMVPEQWMLASHDERNVYVLKLEDQERKNKHL